MIGYNGTIDTRKGVRYRMFLSRARDNVLLIVYL